MLSQRVRDLRARPWRIVGRSQIGEDHVARALPCQDRMGWMRLPGDACVVAVADGAGCAARSDIGAALGVRLAIHATQRRWKNAQPKTTRALLDATHAVLSITDARFRAVACHMGTTTEDLWTTLSVVIVGPGYVSTAQVGDCVGVVRDLGGSVRILAPAYKGEFANQVVFLGCKDTLPKSHVVALRREVQSLALLTDGLETVAMSSNDSPHVPFFDEAFDRVSMTESLDDASEMIGNFLASPEIACRTNDDRTLVMAWRHRASS